MSMISYAQNFEDVMLWRALGHIDNGFYIDVGANDPIVDSVSLAFYKKGWRGVHVEPVSSLAYSISKSRPDESLEQAAVGTNEGKIIFYEVEGTGLSTAEEEIAARHRESGFKVFEREVECITLDSIFEKYHKNEIHWLKIDVEGREKDVLESWHVSGARPWIIVVESTVPLSGEENFQAWEAGLCDKGYSFVYFDGLNRFYLHENHADLQRHFSAPPNVFDNFVLSESNWMCAHIVQRKKQLEESEEHASRLDNEIKDLRASLERLELEHSRSESRAARAEAAEEALSQQLEDVFFEPILAHHLSNALVRSSAFLNTPAWCQKPIKCVGKKISYWLDSILESPCPPQTLAGFLGPTSWPEGSAKSCLPSLFK